jgi:hypothetical protein
MVCVDLMLVSKETMEEIMKVTEKSLLRLEHKRNPMGPLVLCEAVSDDFISIERVVLAPELVGYYWHLFSASQFFDLMIYEVSK